MRSKRGASAVLVPVAGAAVALLAPVASLAHVAADEFTVSHRSLELLERRIDDSNHGRPVAGHGSPLTWQVPDQPPPGPGPLGELGGGWTAAFSPLLPSTHLAAGPSGDLASVGRLLGWRWTRGYVEGRREQLSQSLRDQPTLTVVGLGSSALVCLGTWIGWGVVNEERLKASTTLEVGGVDLGVSAAYDFGSGDWAGGVRLDLARVVGPAKDHALP